MLRTMSTVRVSTTSFVVLGLIGMRSLKKGVPPIPDDLGSELAADAKALKGEQP